MLPWHANPKQGDVPSVELLGKRAWAVDNIVLFPFPLCVSVTPFTKPSASAAATVPQLEYSISVCEVYLPAVPAEGAGM